MKQTCHSDDMVLMDELFKSNSPLVFMVDFGEMYRQELMDQNKQLCELNSDHVELVHDFYSK